MASRDASLATNNPFRRKSSSTTPASPSPADNDGFGYGGPFDAPAPASTTTTTTTRVPLTTFRSDVSEHERRREDEHPIQQKPKKIVKKVRVQSPPPSSPEDAVPVTRFSPPVDAHTDNSDSATSDDHMDPFDAASVSQEERLSSEPPLPQIPMNPFARTLQDIEASDPTSTPTTSATSASKRGLDVDSFKRLLLTGYANIPAPAQPAGSTKVNDGASSTDASSVSKQSSLDIVQETPRTSHEISETEDSGVRRTVPSSRLPPARSASLRQKPPPPPSSRHGKLIKIELGVDGTPQDTKSSSAASVPDPPSPALPPPRKPSSESSTPLHSPPPATDVNKPLPAPPVRTSVEEEIESPFDREAAGKVPEAFTELQASPRPPTPPLTTRDRSASQTSTQPRKPAAPPPRRHGRNDSKISPAAVITAEDEPARSSMESTRSRADSFRPATNSDRTPHPPAPPPPRRPTHNRQSSIHTNSVQPSYPTALSHGVNDKERSPLSTGSTPLTSPGVPITENAAGFATAAATKDGLPKLQPPPPPPARKQSTRRPPSIRSVESSQSVRRVSREKDAGVMPPPPPPPRPRKGGKRISDGVRQGNEENIMPATDPMAPGMETGGKQGEEILADLDALKREVDELMKKSGGS
ncbi:hypothetical protein GGR57DRAFT_234619 [Xylariaceae sp. FL1272]|nr:hypothetical protein GGR57DRAFT_234619 [Xylariaceae sp. FL1272]